MLKTLRNTGMCLLVLMGAPACEEESTFSEFLKPALDRGLEFGYLYRDMEPTNAGVVMYSQRTEDDELPRQEINIRLSSVNEGNYPISGAFKVRDIGENTSFAEVRIRTRHKISGDKPEYSNLRVLGGSVSLLDNAPGRGEWNTDGTPVDVSAELTVNRQRFSPIECKTNDDKEKNIVTVECDCVNALREAGTCVHSGPQQDAYTQDFEAICCDTLGLFEDLNETVKFETRAHFKAELCTSSARKNTAEVQFCK